MKSNRNTLLIVLIAVLALALILFFFFNEEDRYNWRPTYSNQNEQPYDISLFKKTLEASYGEDNFSVVKNLNTDTAFGEAENALFIYIHPEPRLDSVELAQLDTFTARGNRVLISSSSPANLLRERFSDCLPNDSASRRYTDYFRAKTAYLSLKKFRNDTALPLRYMVRDEKLRFPWPYFDLQECESAEAITLGTFKAIDRNFVNFIRINNGDGAYYLHATPLLFTNYHFQRKADFEHTQKLLSMIPKVDILYYEPDYFTPATAANNQPPISESPLRFILANPPLKWAWYLIIALTVIYVFNTVRRRQKAIPVFSLPQNETANYLDVVSRMYQKEGRHKHIIGIQEKLLKRHLQNKYRINIRLNDADAVDEAARRLQMETRYIKQFFSGLERAKNNSTLTDEEFKNTIDKIQEFYRKCP